MSTPALWVPGVIMLPLSWVLTWTAAATTQDDSCLGTGVCRDIDYFLYSWIPIAGPWFMLGQDDTRPLNGDEIAGALLAGIAQVGSLALIVLGLVIRQRVRQPVFVLGPSERSPALSFNALPTEGMGGQLGVQLTHF